MFLIVEPGQRGFVRRFGKIQRENLHPGIHVHFPPPIARGEAYPVQEVRRIDIGFEGTDQNSRTATLIEGGVYQEALYITGDENIIDLNYDDIVRQVSKISRKIAGEQYGIEILSVAIRRLMYPKQNLESVYKRMTAERQRIAKKYRSEREEEALKIRAEADKKANIIISEAKKQDCRLNHDRRAADRWQRSSDNRRLVKSPETAG